MADPMSVLSGRTLAREGFISGQVELTSTCFQRCTSCDSWREHVQGRQYGEWGMQDFLMMCSELDEMEGFESLTLTGGDPLAWPHFRNFVLGEMAGYGFRFKLVSPMSVHLDGHLLKTMGTGFTELKLSMDAANPTTYEIRRGVLCNPVSIFERVAKAGFPSVVVNTVVTGSNIDEVSGINQMAHAYLGESLRKHVVTPQFGCPILGDLKRRYEAMAEAWRARPEAKVDVMPLEHPVPEDHVRCWCSRMSFHMKATMRIYPCCLLGGEALRTDTRYSYGRYPEESMADLAKKAAKPVITYGPMGCITLCKTICQPKQCLFNDTCEAATHVHVTMP